MPRAYGTTNAAPYAVAPPVGASGDTYYNTTSKIMYLSDGISWVAVQSGGGSGIFDGFTRMHASSTGSTDTTAAITGGAYNDIPLALVVDTQGSTYTPNGANTRFTIPADGVYDISAHISAAAAGWPASGGLWWSITVNGLVLERTYTNGGQAYESSTLALQRFLRAGDQVGVMIYSGSATTIRVMGQSGAYGSVGDARQPWLSVWRSGTGPKGDVGPAGGLLGTTGYYYGYATGVGVAASATTAITWNTQGVISGFTPALGGSGTAITATIAGRYKVDAQITVANGATATAWTIGRIEHYNAVGSLLAQRDVVGGGVTAGGYSEPVVSGVFDMAVGDYVRVLFQPNQAGTLDGRTWVEITPVGGAKGDTGATGPDVTAAQSSYWFGTISTPASGVTLGADVQTTIGWTTTRTTGFTLASSNQRITPPAAGRYQVTAEMSYNSGANASTFSRAVIIHFNSAGVEQSRVNGVGSGAAGNQYAFASADGVLNMAAGDYLVVQGAINSTTGSFSNNVFCSVVPVGGVKGDPGPTGATGPAGAGAGTGFVARGEWSNAVPYNPMEVVTKNGVAFLAMAANTNVDPGSLPAGSFVATSDLLASIAAIGKVLPWTPVWRQGVTLGVVVASAWYARVGDWVIGEFNVAFNSNGTAGQPLQMDLPVPLRNVTGGANAQDIGSSFFYTGANNYMTLLATSVNYTQFASGAAYYTAQVLSTHQMTGFFMYPAPVGV